MFDLPFYLMKSKCDIADTCQTPYNMMTRITLFVALISLMGVASGVHLRQYSESNCNGNLRICKDVVSRFCCRSGDHSYTYTSGSCIYCRKKDSHLM